MQRKIRRLRSPDEDPLAGVANFFDLGVVFALSFLLLSLTYLGLDETMSKQDITVVKNPGTSQMEIIRKKWHKLERYRMTLEKMRGEGDKLGTAYRLKTGEVVYVPEEPENR